MVVTTKSGSKYTFSVTDNKLYFSKGIQEGVVSSINGLEVGKELELHFYPLDHCYNQSDELKYARSTEIISIE